MKSEATHSQAGAGGLTKTQACSRTFAQNYILFTLAADSLFSLSHILLLSLCLSHSVLSQGLYCDIRQLVQFIKEAHGNVFRRVALSALLDSAEKVTATKKPDEKEETKQPGPRRYTQWLETVLM